MSPLGSIRQSIHVQKEGDDSGRRLARQKKFDASWNRPAKPFADNLLPVFTVLRRNYLELGRKKSLAKGAKAAKL
jgi:hypothetical protein